MGSQLQVSGKCRVCGRAVEGELVREGTSQAVGACPQCGVLEFYIDFSSPVTASKKRRGYSEDQPPPESEKPSEEGTRETAPRQRKPPQQKPMRREG